MSCFTHIELNDQDLLNKKYSIKLLEKNIDNLSISRVLNTQILTPEFCVKYILNDHYASCVEETYICDLDVLHRQHHIKQSDLIDARLKLQEINISISDHKINKLQKSSLVHPPHEFVVDNKYIS